MIDLNSRGKTSGRGNKRLRRVSVGSRPWIGAEGDKGLACQKERPAYKRRSAFDGGERFF